MANDDGFHPPRFSEETAWLPPWLRSSQMLVSIEGQMPDDRRRSLEILEYPQGNVGGGQDNYVTPKEDPRFFSCHLFLSGDDNSSLLKTHPSGSVPHFCLRLSSEYISQVSLYEFDKVEKIGISVNDRESVPDHYVVENGPQPPNKDSAANIIERGCPQRINFRSSLPFPRGDQDNDKMNMGQDDGLLETVDVDDAVELTIAASEALVISELTTRFPHPEFFNTAALLEVALRVKQARNECHVGILEPLSLSPTIEHDEIDQLIDLDDDTMADAFEDVGLSNEGDRTSNGSLDSKISPGKSYADICGSNPGHSLYGSGRNISNILLSEYHGFSVDRQNKSKDQHLDTSAISSPQRHNHDSTMHSKLRMQPLQTFLPYKMEASVCRAIADVSIARDQDGNAILCGDRNTRQKVPTFFHGETSFISESMDVPADGTERTPEVESKIIASSSSSFEGFHGVPNVQGKSSTVENVMASCDLFEIDILCSVVPCSLSSDRTHVREHGEQDIAVDAGWCLNEIASVQNHTEFPPALVDAERGNSIASKGKDKDSIVTPKKLNSLKEYSVLMPTRSTFLSEKGSFLKEPMLSASINEYHAMLPLNGDARIIEKPTISVSEQTLKHTERANKYSDTVGPIILNTGTRRRLRACNTAFIEEYENKNPRTLLPPETDKHKSRNFLDEHHLRNKAFVSMTCSPSSSSHAHCLEVQHPPAKKVRFLEAEANIHYLPAYSSKKQRLTTKGLGSSGPGDDIHCNNDTRCRMKINRKEKGSCKPSKSTISKMKYLTNVLYKDGKRQMLKGLEFLLTGFSRKKKGEVATLIRRYGGLVLSDCRLPCQSMHHIDQHPPIVLSSKKVQTTIFLYGCAIKTWLLHNNWLSDSVLAGFLLPPGKYLIVPEQISERKHMRVGQLHPCSCGTIFGEVRVMLFGKTNFCAKFSKIVKLGGGEVSKSLHGLVQSLKNGCNTVGAIIVEDETNVSRHLKHCALENDLYIMPASWIVNCLFSGKVLPFRKDRTAPFHRIKKPRFPHV